MDAARAVSMTTVRIGDGNAGENDVGASTTRVEMRTRGVSVHRTRSHIRAARRLTRRRERCVAGGNDAPRLVSSFVAVGVVTSRAARV
jgi:hypothetical protein